MATKTQSPPPAPVRIRAAQAAAILTLSTASVYRLIAKGDLTAVRTNPRGRGQTVWLDPVEVDLYGRGEFAELKELQAKKRKRNKSTSR